MSSPNPGSVSHIYGDHAVEKAIVPVGTGSKTYY